MIRNWAFHNPDGQHITRSLGPLQNGWFQIKFTRITKQQFKFQNFINDRRFWRLIDFSIHCWTTALNRKVLSSTSQFTAGCYGRYQLIYCILIHDSWSRLLKFVVRRKKWGSHENLKRFIFNNFLFSTFLYGVSKPNKIYVGKSLAALYNFSLRLFS